MLVLNLDSLDDKQKKRIKRLGTFFLIVLSANIVSGFLFPPSVSTSIESSESTNTIIQLGLPSQMEAQLETWARDEPIGATLNFGECSVAHKVEDRKWVLEIC